MDPFQNLDRVYTMVMQEESHRGIATSREPTLVVGFYAQNDRPSVGCQAAHTSGPSTPDLSRTPLGLPWCTYCSRVGHT